MSKVIARENGNLECPACEYIFDNLMDVSYDDNGNICCPDCGEVLDAEQLRLFFQER